MPSRSCNASVGVSAEGATLEVRRDRLARGACAWSPKCCSEPAFPAPSSTSSGAARSPPSNGERKATRHRGEYPPRPPSAAPTRAATRSRNARSTSAPRDLRAITLDAVKDCYRDFVGATGATIAVVGDIEPDALSAQLDAAVRCLEEARAPTSASARAISTSQPIHRSIVIPDKANATLRGGLTLPMRDDDADFPAMVLGNYLLGGTATSRLPDAHPRDAKACPTACTPGFAPAAATRSRASTSR